MLRGIVCPTCGRAEYVTVGRYRPCRGRRVRYFQCLNPECRERFKTLETGAQRVRRKPPCTGDETG